MGARAKRRIVFFDGACALCNGAVQFVLDRDPKGHFHFASLQGDLAREILVPLGGDPSALGTMYLVIEGEDGTRELLDRSSAGLEIAAGLTWPWAWLSALRIVPRWIRDRVYGFVARHRYAWSGKLDACRLPDPAWKHRFLDA